MWTNGKSSVTSKTSYTSKNTCPYKISNGSQRKVIPSKKLSSSGNGTKSCSTSVVSANKHPSKPRKTTSSDITVTEKTKITKVDYCKKCGDAVDKNITPVTQTTTTKTQNEEIGKIVKTMNEKSVRNDNNVIMNKISSAPIQQYYRNKNFAESTESVVSNDRELNHKNSLDTIKEVSELHGVSNESLVLVYSDEDEEVTYLDPDDEDNIEKLKQFRNKNYFECHSAKSRIKHRGSTTSLNEHKCVYRFYLNDRLFPVPLNADYNNNVRCVECQLPMNIKNDSENAKINGTIQAKVKIGKDTQDVILLLPITESLIIKERRKEERKVNDDYVYFGVVKLGTYGNSMFKSTLPQDSLALKYQRGYKEYGFDDRYTYKSVCEDDLVVI